MTTYRVDFRNGRKPIYGEISTVEARQGYFLFLERGMQDQIGMVGKDGIRINFDECTGVYAMDPYSPDFFGGEEQIQQWRLRVGVF
jgi:hypothetical protein